MCESDGATAKTCEEDDLSLLPDALEKPLPSECCGSGCRPCVMDVYEEQLEIWRTLQVMNPGERVRYSQ